MSPRRLNCDLSPEVRTCLKMNEMKRFDCCHVHDKIPDQVECYLKDINKSLGKLYARHEQMFVRRKRLHELAVPKYRMCRFVPKCPCKFENPIEIIQSDKPKYTRTEQLALPLVRRLLLRRATVIAKKDKITEMILNRNLRYQYMSMYSRLTGIKPLQEPKKKKPKTKKQKGLQKTSIEKLAKPKKKFPPPKLERKAGAINMERITKLALPRGVEEHVKPQWVFTAEMKNYKASKRLAELAAHKEHENVHINMEPEKVSPNAKLYKASPRILQLSAPLLSKETAVADVKEQPFSISPNALKYKASSRIKELAEPREFENAHIRDNPFGISPAALKAKPSPRIVELAKPKGG